MSSLTAVRTTDLTEEVQAAIEEIAADLSQSYGFDFPLELLESCYQQVPDMAVVQIIAVRVSERVDINPDDILDEDRLARHVLRLERAFQYYIDEHLND